MYTIIYPLVVSFAPTYIFETLYTYKTFAETSLLTTLMITTPLASNHHSFQVINVSQIEHKISKDLGPPHAGSQRCSGRGRTRCVREAKARNLDNGRKRKDVIL